MAPYDNSKDDSAETLENNIPIIDLAGVDGPHRQKICQQIAEACETWGFFHLINHGIDQSLIKRVKDVSTEFFHGPEEEKLKVQANFIDGWHHPKYKIQGNGPIQMDIVEHLTLSQFPERQVPQQPASYKSILLEYTKELKFLGEKLLSILSEMLGLGPEAMKTALTAGPSIQSLNISIKTNFYGLNEDGEALPAVCQAHSDPGGLTILLADDAPGLEVRKNGRWVKVDPILGGLIINMGDMLEVCSNGRYKSVEHRGMPCPKQERLTLAVFLGAKMDVVIGPIRSLLDESHPPLYKTSTYGAYLGGFMKAGQDGKVALESHKL